MDKIPALRLEVVATDNQTETVGTVTVPLAQDPLEASMQIRLYITEALCALQAMHKASTWTFYLNVEVERSFPPNPTQKRWKEWLRHQGILPAIQWYKTPVIPLLPPEEKNPEKNTS